MQRTIIGTPQSIQFCSPCADGTRCMRDSLRLDPSRSITRSRLLDRRRSRLLEAVRKNAIRECRRHCAIRRNRTGGVSRIDQGAAAASSNDRDESGIRCHGEIGGCTVVDVLRGVRADTAVITRTRGDYVAVQCEVHAYCAIGRDRVRAGPDCLDSFSLLLSDLSALLFV